MTLDEAIRHAKETAEMMYRRAEIEADRDECLRCAEEHRQLAMWLSELKYYRKAGRLP